VGETTRRRLKTIAYKNGRVFYGQKRKSRHKKGGIPPKSEFSESLVQ